MSDQEIILRTLREADRRIRTNRCLERLTVRLSFWIGLAVLMKLLDFIRPFPQGAIRGFWIVWFAGAAAILLWSLRLPQSLKTAASTVDQRAHLKDEVLSAWWFINNGKHGTPWVDLHLRHAAARLSGIDIGRLCPRAVPRASYLAAGGIVLLIALHFAPLRFSSGWVFSGPRPPLDEQTETGSLLEEIESLLERAEALEQTGTLGDFLELMEDLQDPEVSLPAAQSGLDSLQSALEGGNLNTSGILEGLEDMAEELARAADTAAAGEAMGRGDLATAAAELDQLAQALAGGQPPGADLAEALARAGEDARAGLEALAGDLQEAARNLGNEENARAGESLGQAADALGELSDRIESQNLRNQASDRIDSLREALERQQEAEAGGQQDAGPAPASEEGAGQQQAQPGDSAGQAGESGEASEAGAAGNQPAGGDQAPSGPAETGEATRGQGGSLDSAAGGDSGMLPAGLGYSPDQKTGLPTSLEVQLEQEATGTISPRENPAASGTPEEEASRQEQSRLEYRNVPSELTPAQQELLDQERIPREYQNLIRDYFQAIRPSDAP